jgi:hypothetical protein
MSAVVPVLRRAQEISVAMGDLEHALRRTSPSGPTLQEAKEQLQVIARQLRNSGREVRNNAAELEILGFDDIATTLQQVGSRIQITGILARLTNDPDEHGDVLKRVLNERERLNESISVLVRQSAQSFGGHKPSGTESDLAGPAPEAQA